MDEARGDADAPAPPGPLPARSRRQAEEHRIAVARSARYYTAGAAPADAGELWYVLHGYSQLAAAFIRPFGALDNTHRRIVAPEALSRFYRDGAHTQVGATWMTREDRLREIDDYLTYLDALHARILASGVGADVPVHVLGFSQGAETAARWVALGDVKPQRLIVWGGRIPADLDLAVYRDIFSRVRLVLVRGESDEIATPERAAEEESRLNAHTIPYQTLTFEGGHEIDVEVLRDLAAR